MAVEDHIRALRTKHATLDQAILKEESRPMPDDLKVSEWKREKLRIKDAIADLSRQQVM